MTDAPIFDPHAWKLTDLEAELTTRARTLGKELGAHVAVPRA